MSLAMKTIPLAIEESERSTALAIPAGRAIANERVNIRVLLQDMNTAGITIGSFLMLLLAAWLGHSLAKSRDRQKLVQEARAKFRSAFATALVGLMYAGTDAFALYEAFHPLPIVINHDFSDFKALRVIRESRFVATGGNRCFSAGVR